VAERIGWPKKRAADDRNLKRGSTSGLGVGWGGEGRGGGGGTGVVTGWGKGRISAGGGKSCGKQIEKNKKGDKITRLSMSIPKKKGGRWSFDSRKKGTRGSGLTSIQNPKASCGKK